jgi:hypothetical protein
MSEVDENGRAEKPASPQFESLKGRPPVQRENPVAVMTFGLNEKPLRARVASNRGSFWSAEWALAYPD